MTEAPARTWLRQAHCDYETSRRIAGKEMPPGMYCQVLSKQQQAVEKCIKAVVAAWRDRGLLKSATSRQHVVDSKIEDILSALRRAPRGRGDLNLIQDTQNLLHAKNVQEINDLRALAPKWPGPGQLFPRNTEYPYEPTAGQWAAPADKDSFSKNELKKFTRLSQDVVSEVGKIVSAAER